MYQPNQPNLPTHETCIYTNNGGLIGVAWVGSSDVGTQPEPTQLAVFTCVYKLLDGCAVVVLVVLCWLGLGRFKQGADPPMGFGASPSPPNRGRGRESPIVGVFRAAANQFRWLARQTAGEKWN